MPGYLLDPSVWIAWFFQPHPLNTLATVLLEARSGSDPAWRCRATEQPCLRLATTNTVCRAYSSSVLTNVQVTAAPSTWYAQSHVRCLDAEPGGTPALWLELAPIPPASPKVWMDAYLAAFAIRAKLPIATLDSDFRRFEAASLQPPASSFTSSPLDPPHAPNIITFRNGEEFIHHRFRDSKDFNLICGRP